MTPRRKLPFGVSLVWKDGETTTTYHVNKAIAFAFARMHQSELGNAIVRVRVVGPDNKTLLLLDGTK